MGAPYRASSLFGLPGVSTADLEDVLYNTTASLGFFVDQVLLGREPKAAVIAA